MQPLEWFREKIGSKIYRGNAEVLVTEKNYEKLHSIQDKEVDYLFTSKPVGS